MALSRILYGGIIMVYTGITGTVQGASPNNDPGVICGANLDLSGIIPAGQTGNCYSSDGQLWIGSTASTLGGTHARIGNITSIDGSITVDNGSGSIDLSGTAQGFQPNAVLQEFDDFISWQVGNAQNVSKLNWIGSALYATAGTTDHPGIVSIESGASEDYIYMLQTTQALADTSPFSLGGGVLSISWNMKLASLSTGANDYTISLGLADSATIKSESNAFVNGVYFQYNHAVNSGNWQIKSTNASTTTTANTSTVADTNYHTFTIVVNSGASSVAYYIDNVQVANSPIITNIPTAAITPFVYIKNNAGTHPETHIDLFWITKQLSNPRPGPVAGVIPADSRIIDNYTQTAISYQVLGTDAIVGVTSTAAARTLTMPIVGIVAGQTWRFKDESGGAATNNITVNGNGYNIDGAATYVININYGAIDIYFSGSAFFVL